MPDIEDDDETPEVAPSAVERLRERVGKGRATESEEDPDVVTVQEPEEDDELDPEVPKTRDERRAARRKQTLREEKAAAEAKAEVYRQELESLRQRPAAQQQEQRGPSQLDRAYLDVEREHERVVLECRTLEKEGKLTDALYEDFRNKARILEIRKIGIVSDMKAAAEAPQRARDQAMAELRRRNPDIWENPAAIRYAEGEYNKRVARGEPDSVETHDAAAAEARLVILRKRPAPDAAQRQRATGMSGGTRGATPDAPVRLSMPVGSREYQLACARYPSDTPGVACQKWANKHGKALQEARANRAH